MRRRRFAFVKVERACRFTKVVRDLRTLRIKDRKIDPEFAAEGQGCFSRRGPRELKQEQRMPAKKKKKVAKKATKKKAKKKAKKH